MLISGMYAQQRVENVDSRNITVYDLKKSEGSVLGVSVESVGFNTSRVRSKPFHVLLPQFRERL